MKAGWALVAGPMVWVMTGCGGNSPRIDAENRVPSHVAGPTVVPLDTVVLRGPESLAIGQLADGVRGQDGTVFVSDFAGGRVLRFRADGSFDRAIGAPGNGPGELPKAGRPVLIYSDTVLAVHDGASAIQLFDARVGTFLGAIRGTVRLPGHTWTEIPEGYVFGTHFEPHPVVRWDGRANAIVGVGRVPDASLAAGPSYLTLGQVDAITDGTAFLVHLPAEPGLQRVDQSGALISVFPVPAARRRGNPPDLLARQVARDAEGGPPSFLGSSAAGMARLSTGEVAVLHADISAPVPPADAGGVSYFVSILSSDLRSACVDGAVPFPTDVPLPYLWFQGDTLVGLSRHSQGGSVRTVVRRYSVSSEGCEWVGRVR